MKTQPTKPRDFKFRQVRRDGEDFVRARVAIGDVEVQVILRDNGRLLVPFDVRTGIPTVLQDAELRAAIQEDLAVLRDWGDLGFAVPAKGTA